MDWTAILERFADAGLVFLVMALVIYFLYREYRRVATKLNEVQEKYTEAMRENNDKNLETMIKFSSTLERLYAIIKAKE